MAKCSECGFLAVWHFKNYKFLEASNYFRSNGALENEARTLSIYETRCFCSKADLAHEVTQDQHYLFAYPEAVKNIISKERKCGGETPWLQGFHPKEHVEMQDRLSERRWRFAEGLIFAIAGGVVALFSQWVAKPDVPVININPPTVNVTTPPVNVTIQAPPPAKSTKKAEQK